MPSARGMQLRNMYFQLLQQKKQQEFQQQQSQQAQTIEQQQYQQRQAQELQGRKDLYDYELAHQKPQVANSPFEVWQKQNPNASISDWFTMQQENKSETGKLTEYQKYEIGQQQKKEKQTKTWGREDFHKEIAQNATSANPKGIFEVLGRSRPNNPVVHDSLVAEILSTPNNPISPDEVGAFAMYPDFNTFKKNNDLFKSVAPTKHKRLTDFAKRYFNKWGK